MQQVQYAITPPACVHDVDLPLPLILSLQRNGNYRIDGEATPTMLNSLMYKLSYYR